MGEMPFYREFHGLDPKVKRLVTIIIIASLWIPFVIHFVFKVPLGDKDINNPIVIALWVLVGLGVPLFIINGGMETLVTTTGIKVRQYWIFGTTIKYDKIKRVRKTEIKFKDVGGYGYRYSRKLGRCFVLHEGEALTFELEGHKKVTISTENRDRLLEAIKMFLPEKVFREGEEKARRVKFV